MFTKSSLIALALGFSLAGCDYYREDKSGLLQEPAEVVQLVFTPSLHDSSVSPTINFNGDIGLAYSSVDVPEKYAVVFQCQHGKFIIDGEKGHELWKRLKNNQKVVVSYYEVFESHFDSDDKLLERRLKKYEFAGAM